MNFRTLLGAALAGALMTMAGPGVNAEEGVRLPAIKDALAKQECSACHMAYPASLLPSRSWRAILSDLGNHFGEDASLDPKAEKQISDYLAANAADTGGKLAGIMRGLKPADTPLRISELPIMRRIHDEVGSRWRKRVGSMGKCNACHRGAEKGFFEEG